MSDITKTPKGVAAIAEYQEAKIATYHKMMEDAKIQANKMYAESFIQNVVFTSLKSTILESIRKNICVKMLDYAKQEAKDLERVDFWHSVEKELNKLFNGRLR